MDEQKHNIETSEEAVVVENNHKWYVINTVIG